MQKFDISSKEQANKWHFTITISGEETQTEHQVTLGRDYYQRLTNGLCEPEKLIEKSFEFLLKREPQESILPKFDLTVISTYFPEYEDVLKLQLHS